MTLRINATPNGTYSTNPEATVNNKYSPLINPTLEVDETDPKRKEKDLEWLFDQRIKALSAFGAPPTRLVLYSNWTDKFSLPGTPLRPRDQNPPVVVISSRRASFLHKWFVDNTPANPLWYSPARLGRQLLVVVHRSEYGYYREQLGQVPRLLVVGWHVEGPQLPLELVGFGASRFASLALVKELGYNKAWTVDDNVARINGFTFTLDKLEDQLGDGLCAVGFKATAANTDFGSLQSYQPLHESQAAPAITKPEPGLLQQVVLWNVEKLRTRGVNFCPYFVTSNEDVCLSGYLQQQGLGVHVIGELWIEKLKPVGKAEDKDVHAGAIALEGLWRSMLTTLYEAEEAIPILSGSREQPLSEFIRALPSLQPGSGTLPDKDKIRRAQSQAVEQALNAAAKRIEHWAHDPFTINVPVVLAHAAG